MPYTLIEHFRAGLDARRPAIVGEDGSLVALTNAHITAGGDIEQMQRLVVAASLPNGTYGLHALDDRLWVFGTASEPSGMPPSVSYLRLIHPGGHPGALTRILDAESYSGSIYCIAEYDNGAIRHFYDGELVTDWNTIAKDVNSHSAILAQLAEQINTSDDYTASVSGSLITVTHKENGVWFDRSSGVRFLGAKTNATLKRYSTVSGRADVEEIKARIAIRLVSRHTSGGTYQFTQIAIATSEGSKNMFSSAQTWGSGVTGSDFAAQLATHVNANTNSGLSHRFTAVSDGDVLTIFAPENFGAAANSWAVTYTYTGINLSGLDATMASGKDPVVGTPYSVKFQILNDFSIKNEYWIKLGNVEYSARGYIGYHGRVVRAHKSKLHSIEGITARFSAVNNANNWITGIGAGFVSLANQDSGSEKLTAIGLYQGKIAYFSRYNIQIWQNEVEEANSRLVQVLRNTGTRSPMTVLEYGGIDTFYLSDSGVRSLRIREQVDAAFSSDVGSPIDALIQADLRTLDAATIDRAIGCLEPMHGRFWLILGEKAYVLSHFPAARVSAWSIYEPGFTISHAVSRAGRLWLRSGNTIYVYGGSSGTNWPQTGTQPVTVRTSYMTFGKPAHLKHSCALDIACQGTWRVWALTDPRNPAIKVDLGTISNATFDQGRINFPGNWTHLALELTAAGDSAAPPRLHRIAIHYEFGEAA